MPSVLPRGEANLGEFKFLMDGCAVAISNQPTCSDLFMFSATYRVGLPLLLDWCSTYNNTGNDMGFILLGKVVSATEKVLKMTKVVARLLLVVIISHIHHFV